MDAVAWRRGRLSLVLLAVTAIVFAACTSSGGTSSSAPAASEAPAGDGPGQRSAGEPSARQRGAGQPDPRPPARQGPAGGQDRDVHRSRVPTAVVPERDDRHIRRLRHRRWNRDRETARGRHRFHNPRSGRSSRPGRWAGRWDFSVGSMTITSDRQKILDFTEPYYFTPAQLAARKEPASPRPMGSQARPSAWARSTTYFQWRDRARWTSEAEDAPRRSRPTGSQATTLETRTAKCAEAWQLGRKEFDGWLQFPRRRSIGGLKDGLPVVPVGDPVFYEPLAAALDKSGPRHTPSRMLAAMEKKIVGDMHADGTLTALSEKWFGGRTSPNKVSQ